MSRKKLGELLRDADLISDDDLERALAHQRATGERLGSALMGLGLVRPAILSRVLAEQFQIEGIDPEDLHPTGDALALLSEQVAFDLGCLPVRIDGEQLVVAMTDPTNDHALARLESITGCAVRPMVAPQTAVYRALKRHYGGGVSAAQAKRIAGRLEQIRAAVDEIQAVLDLAGAGE